MQALHNGLVFDGTTFSSNRAVLISNDLIVDIIPESEIPSSAQLFNLPAIVWCTWKIIFTGLKF